MRLKMKIYFVVFLISLIQGKSIHRYPRYKDGEILDRNRRMLGGREADFADWSFIVSLTFKQPLAPYKICSGALITRHLVITAAHCVEDIKNQPQFLEVSLTNASNRTLEAAGKKETFKASKIKTHQLFSMKKLFLPDDVFSWDFDIAIIQLKRKAPETISKILLPRNRFQKIKCTAAGWGSTRELKNINDSRMMNYEISKTLQEIDVPIVPWNQCHDFYTPNHEEFRKYNHRVFCGGEIDITGKHDVGGCIGDSGSPLVCKDHHDMVLSGIMLGGHPLCSPGNSFMIFTNVSKYRHWIRRTIADLQNVDMM